MGAALGLGPAGFPKGLAPQTWLAPGELVISREVTTSVRKSRRGTWASFFFCNQVILMPRKFEKY